MILCLQKTCYNYNFSPFSFLSVLNEIFLKFKNIFSIASVMSICFHFPVQSNILGIWEASWDYWITEILVGTDLHNPGCSQKQLLLPKSWSLWKLWTCLTCHLVTINGLIKVTKVVCSSLSFLLNLFLHTGAFSNIAKI